MGLSGGGGGQSSQPPPPKVYPVDIEQTLKTGIAADQFGYNFSDTDFAKRFPGLVATRGEDIKKATQELTGPLDPVVQNDFATRALEKSFTAFGSGSATPDVTSEGSIGRNTIGASIANDTSAYQDAARSYVQSLTENNPQRAFGLAGSDVLNLAILNQGNLAQANQQAAGYASAVGAANAQASASKTQAAVGAGAAILGSVIAAVH